VVAVALDASGDRLVAPSLAAVSDLVHRAACQRAVACGVMPSVADCLSSTTSPVTDRIAADVEAGRAILDAQAAQALADWLASEPCGLTVSYSRDTRGTLAAKCAAAFKGAVPSGGTCSVDVECALGLVCDHVRGGVYVNPGSCDTPPAMTALGDFCTDPASCGPTNVCDFYTNRGHAECAPVPTAVGAACDFAQGCGGHLLCVSNACARLAATGSTCDRTSNYLPCDDPRDFCTQGQPNTCQPLHVEGAACDLDEGNCLPYLWCNPATAKCEARVALGGSCGDSRRCLGETDCGTGTCVLDPGFTPTPLMACP